MNVVELNKSKIVTERHYDITMSPSIDAANGWKTEVLTQSEFESCLLTHQELERKEAAIAFLPGAVRADKRLKSNVEALSALVLDLDKGTDLSTLEATIRDRGLYAI